MISASQIRKKVSATLPSTFGATTPGTPENSEAALAIVDFVLSYGLGGG
jgi:hypothetical protein